MKYYRLPMSERDFERMPQVVQINETECIAQAQDDAVISESAVEITEDEFNQLQPEITSEPTIEEEVAELKEQNLILMDALATTFEEVLALRAIVEGGTA